MLAHQDGIYPATLTTPPSVSFSSTPVEVYSGVSETFSASASDPDGKIVSYQWTFTGTHDGADLSDDINGTATGQSVSYTVPEQVNQNGTMTVAVTVEDNDGARDRVSTEIPVKADFRKNLVLDLPLDEDPIVPADDAGGSYSLTGDATIVEDSVRGPVMETSGDYIYGSDGWGHGGRHNPHENSTWSWWVKPIDSSDPFSFWYTDSGDEGLGRFQWTGDQFHHQDRFGYSCYFSPDESQSLTSGEWTHVVLRRWLDYPMWYEVWVDGDKVGRFESRDVARGGWSHGDRFYLMQGFTGRADDIRAYTGVLTKDEIQKLYKLQKA